MKIVPFYENLPDNKHCLQACIKMASEFLLKKTSFTNLDEIDSLIAPSKEWAWFPPGVIYLNNNLGLKVKLYSIFDYEKFIIKGKEYCKDLWAGSNKYQEQKDNNCFADLNFVQKNAQEMIDKKLWKKIKIDDLELTKLLSNEKLLAIGNGNGHFKVIIKKYSPGRWELHDPGLYSTKANQKIDGQIENIFGEILVVES